MRSKFAWNERGVAKKIAERAKADSTQQTNELERAQTRITLSTSYKLRGRGSPGYKTGSRNKADENKAGVRCDKSQKTEREGSSDRGDGMRMAGTQLSVSQGGEAGVTALLDLSDDSEVGEQEKATTAAVFFGCVSASARSDQR